MEQKYVLLRLPDCLCVVMKRYTYKADYQTAAKNSQPVEVPEAATLLRTILIVYIS